MLLETILTHGRPMLADGSMATNLFERGLRIGDPSEAWNATHPDRVKGLHDDFVDAGAELLLTNSFGGHPRRLRSHGLEHRVDDLNRAAARHARAATDRAGRAVYVAGAVGPTGDRIVEDGAAAGFAEQMQALAAGGVDLLWIETMSFADEILVACEAAARTGLPYGLTASFGADGRTLGGLDAAAFTRLAAALPVPPILLGANCGAGTEALLSDLAAMRAAAPGLSLAAKASAGLPDLRDGSLHYPRTPADMACYAERAAAAGLAVVGGCCGTTPAHLRAMQAALAQRATAL